MKDIKFQGCALDFWSKNNPEKVAIYSGSHITTYAELVSMSSSLAAYIKSIGMNKFDNVVIFVPDSVEFVVAFYASLKLSLNIVPANFLYKQAELEQVIYKNNPKLVFVYNEEGREMIKAIDPELKIVMASFEDPKFVEMVSGSEKIEGFPEDFTDYTVRISTSGSTGRMKFVERTIQSQIIVSRGVANALHVTQDDVCFIPLPLSQQFGMVAMIVSIINGCSMVLPPRFKSADALSLVEKYRVTVQFGVPTMYVKEIESYENAEAKPDITSLRAGMLGGADSPKPIFEWFENKLGCHLVTCYGCTETAVMTMGDSEDPLELRYSNSGRLFGDGIIVEIIDDDGNVLPAGQTGEVVCTTPCMMNCYVGEPEMTAAVLDDKRRFFTGDIGMLDENGYLIICGRKKDMIIRGGYNVFPAEVELELLHLPEIAEACVIGYKDEILGERIAAYIRLQAGAKADAESLRNKLIADIAKYKVPDKIIFMNEIPTLANGKYDRSGLKKQLMA